MTDTLEHHHPAEFTSLASQQRRLLEHTNWQVLFYDYAQPPLADDDDAYNRGMSNVPSLLETLAGDTATQPDVLDTKQYLASVYTGLDALGYIRRTPPEAHGRHEARPPQDIAAYIDSWLKHTSTGSLYMRGSRYEQAISTLPMQRLQTLAGVADLHKGQLPPQIEAGLWAAVQRLTDDYDELISSEHYNNYYNIQLHGSENLERYGIRTPVLADIITQAQHSYPPELMRGLESISALDSNRYYYANRQRQAYLGMIFYQERRMELYLPCIAESARTANESQLETLKETLVHEFAHLAHTNAPVEWLRGWEELNKRRVISVSDYANESRSHPDDGRAEYFAEVARVYHRDPLRLMGLSMEHFTMMNSLLKSYDDKTVRAARTLFDANIHSTADNFRAFDNQLRRSRYRTIDRRAHQAAESGSQMGQVVLKLADDDATQILRRAA